MNGFRSEAQTEGPQTTADDLSLSKQAQSALGTDSTDPFDRYLKRMQDSTSVERKKAQEAQTDISTKQIEMEKNRLKQEYDLATKQSGETRGIISDYSKQLMAPSPKREIEAQTKEGMMGLAALLPVAGAFFGGKGLTSATGAMLAMTGLVKGYQEGNKERIAFEQKKYDDAIKEFDRHQQQIKTAFDMALKNAQINQNAAQAKLKMDLYTLNAPMLAELVEKQGIVKTSETNIQMIDNVAKMRLQHEEKVNIAREVAGIRAEAPTAKAKGVQSERETAKPYFNNADLGEKAPAVIGVAKVMGEAADLAQMVQDNPYLVGRTGQAREIKQRLFDSIRNGKPIPEDLQNSSDANVQDAVLFAKKFASFRTRYEQALAGSGKGFTVALQNQYNKLLDPNQFNPQSFVDLMKDLSKEAASGVTGVNKEITYDRLMNYGIDISERAGFEKARSGSTLLKTAPSTNQSKDDKPYSAAEIERFSKQYNKSIDEIKKGLRDRGLKIEGE